MAARERTSHTRSKRHPELSLKLGASGSSMDESLSREQETSEIADDIQVIKISSPKPVPADAIPTFGNYYTNLSRKPTNGKGDVDKTRCAADDTETDDNARDAKPTMVQSSTTDPGTALKTAENANPRSDGARYAQCDVSNDSSLDIVRKMSEVKQGVLQWRKMGSYMELKKQRCRRLYAESGRADDVALFFHNGCFYAMEAWCSHMGGPLYEGDIEDYNGRSHVMCPWHSYMFDLLSGKNEIGLEQKVYELKYEFGNIFIRHRSELSLDPGDRRDSVSGKSDDQVIDIGKRRNVSVLETPIHLTP